MLKEEAYNVFISFKNSDTETEEKTPDRAIAEKVFNYLADKGLNVFFSPITLKALGRDNWEEEINLALKEANVFIAIGTSKKNMNSHWVKVERTSFLALKLVDKSKAIYGYIAPPMELNDIPDDIKKLEVFQDKKPTALMDIYDYICNHLNRSSKPILLLNTNQLTNLRERLLFSHTTYELKKLLYEVELYQSQYPYCVEAKVLKDSITKAIEYSHIKISSAPPDSAPPNNIKKIIYITSTILIILFPIFFIKQYPMDKEITNITPIVNIEREEKERLVHLENETIVKGVIQLTEQLNLDSTINFEASYNSDQTIETTCSKKINEIKEYIDNNRTIKSLLKFNEFDFNKYISCFESEPINIRALTFNISNLTDKQQVYAKTIEMLVYEELKKAIYLQLDKLKKERLVCDKYKNLYDKTRVEKYEMMLNDCEILYEYRLVAFSDVVKRFFKILMYNERLREEIETLKLKNDILNSTKKILYEEE